MGKQRSSIEQETCLPELPSQRLQPLQDANMIWAHPAAQHLANATVGYPIFRLGLHSSVSIASSVVCFHCPGCAGTTPSRV